MKLNVYFLRYIIDNIKPLIDNAIVKKIYKTYNNGIILELYKKDLNNKYLYFIPGKYLFLSNIKITNPTDNFIMRLRKDFAGKKIILDQLDFERTVVVLPKDSEYKLIVELYNPGNIIVVDKNDKIVYALLYKDFGKRKIKPGEVYKYEQWEPPRDFNKFKEYIINSNKKDIVRCLAIDLKLGGELAEKILEAAGIEKTKRPQRLSETELNLLWEEYKTVLNGSFFKDIDITKIFSEYSKELEEGSIYKLNQEKQKLKKILQQQIEQKNKLKKEIEKLEKIGEFLKSYYWVFQNYDINEIKNFFTQYNIKINIKKEGKKLIIELEDQDA